MHTKRMQGHIQNIAKSACQIFKSVATGNGLWEGVHGDSLFNYFVRWHCGDAVALPITDFHGRQGESVLALLQLRGASYQYTGLTGFPLVVNMRIS